MADLRKLAMACALSVPMIALVSPARAQEQPWFGAWDSSRGLMHVEQDGDELRGDYAMMGGRFHGEIEDGGLSGIWAQEYSKVRCHDERLGSPYWGRFRLHLSDDGKYFHGRWSYCDTESGNGEEWNGKRPRHWRP
ncbi:MAG TPA: hypothetical protein VMU01_02750 [Rhizomicrobium sp.]|nr:hypothetical protein [Rhizomicrobium sp.]